MTVNINGTSGVSGVDGTAGTPALQGTDSNTGISFGTDTVNINTGGTTRATVDSSGRVGIGSNAPTALLEVSSATDARIQSTNTAGPTKTVVLSGNGTSYIGTTTNHPQAFITNDAERARIDTSGRLLVGTSSSSHPAKFITQGNATGGNFASMAIAYNSAASAVSAGTTLGEIDFTDQSAGGVFARIRCAGDGTGGTNDYPGRLEFSTTADGASSPTERMRITNGGALCIGKTQASENVTTGSGFGFASPSNDPFFTIVNAQATAGNANIYLNKRTSGAIVVIQANDGSTSTTVGTISHNGTSTAYNTTSDYRLKENIETVTNSITRLQQLKPSRFNFIADPDKTVDGFIAHEVQEVVPEAITGEKDAVDADGNPIYQGIDQSKLVPLLTAALQEAIGRIEALEAEVAALKAQ